MLVIFGKIGLFDHFWYLHLVIYKHSTYIWIRIDKIYKMVLIFSKKIFFKWSKLGHPFLTPYNSLFFSAFFYLFWWSLKTVSTRSVQILFCLTALFLGNVKLLSISTDNFYCQFKINKLLFLNFVKFISKVQKICS